MNNILSVLFNNIEIIFGILTILGFTIWAVKYSKKDPNKINIYTFDFIPHLFPTLGILFTFIGIAVGLYKLDVDNSDTITKTIPLLLENLKTAFIVSIFGVSLLIVFSFWVNSRKKLLDEKIQTPELKALNLLLEELKELKNNLQTTDENGNRITIGNLARDIYKESEKQSTSLRSFSSDLAVTISQGFEQILNNPTEGVVAELKLLKIEIESLGEKLKDPATDMTQNIANELQRSMSKMVDEFKATVSGGAKTEMESLAKILSQAGGSLAEFPARLQEMSDNLNTNFKGLQDVVSQITQQTLSQSETTTNEVRKQITEMSDIIKLRIGDIQNGQQQLINEQTKNLEISENLLDSFNTSIVKMNNLSVDVTDTIGKLNQAHHELDNVMHTFKNISSQLTASSDKFGSSQIAFSEHSNEFLRSNSNIIIEVQKTLDKSKTLAVEYSNRFEIIEKGLQEIFTKINIGLKSYQDEVGQSLEKYLRTYSEALTATAGSLEKAVSKQEVILEDLTEQLGRINKR